MGDKSPKAKDKSRKQHEVERNQKKAAASTQQSNQGAAGAAKRGK